MTRRKRKTGRISVFKGREAKLNRAIFQILALKGPLAIYDIYKLVKKQKLLRRKWYSVVNRRVRALQQSRYLRKTGTRPTLAGFEASLYELTTRGYAAFVFNQINLDRFIKDAEENEILQALTIFVSSI
ncbi:hypothetical protein IBX38_06330 [Candidatus Bathyarchaeota archaeon]|nr:hypothetical protein [Candidatus Bathyarchaeota archaeon]